ncbi:MULTISPECIES: helix-turn-helix domain-containing protein [Agrobacterium tumefaciens complex]|jgi:transposase|uniref:helix-turn-helix domain-containing protein n=1 Tax=Agrobacterium tumefaciens TaxID=358 RepID=UPI000FE297E7|nr:helix-turn-helix domain-containing protein [Agrobacterium tumefaciens]QAB00908.1 hypothetical protein DC439_24150 [Agrobacterium tumefaciens]
MVQTGGLPWAQHFSFERILSGDDLRKAARMSRDVNQRRRFLVLAKIYDGGSRGNAAKVGGVTVQIVRDSVERFNAQGPEGLLNVKAPGKRPKLDDDQRRGLRRIVEKGPIPAIHGVVRWRLKGLARWIFQEYRISLDESMVGRELKAICGRSRERTKNLQDEHGLHSRRYCHLSGLMMRSSRSRARAQGAWPLPGFPIPPDDYLAILSCCPFSLASSMGAYAAPAEVL